MDIKTFVIYPGFIALTIVFYGWLIVELRKAMDVAGFHKDRKKKITLRLLIALLIWAFFVSMWSISGRMSDFSNFPLNMLPILALPFLTILALTFSKTTGEILKYLPSQNLARLQMFRFFVELLLWGLFLQSEMPVQMSFEGRNLDILAGLTAPIVALLIARQKFSRTALLIWNLVCLGLLINILTIAILSMPTSLRVFMNEPSNTIVTVFPVSWLPGFLVPLAYGLHFLSLRQLFLLNLHSPNKSVKKPTHHE